MMSNIEKWWGEKSYATTENVTLLSVIGILFLMISGAYIRKKLKEDSTFYFQGHCYKVIGVGLMKDDKGQEIYVPVYKESK